VPVALRRGRARVSGQVPCGYVYVDGSSVGEIDETELKDRRILAEEGFVSVYAVVETKTGTILAGPDIQARGVAEDDSVFDEILPEVTDVLQAAGYTVLLPPGEACCGLTWISTGQLGTAKRKLGRLLSTLAPFAASGVPIVGVEPSCTAVLRSDLEDLLPDDARAPLVKAMTYTLAELLTAPEPVGPGRGWRMPDLAGVEIVAQPHCHHYSVMGWAADEDLLRKAGASVTKVTGCCGLAGNFGMEKGHYEVSVKVAQARLVPALSEAGRDAVFLADGFSCRTQAGQLAGSRGIHLAELIRDGAEAARRRGGS